MERQLTTVLLDKVKEVFNVEQANKNVRNEIKDAGLTYWQVAEKVGIASTTLSVWLRTPLNESRLARIKDALSALQKGAAINA